MFALMQTVATNNLSSSDIISLMIQQGKVRPAFLARNGPAQAGKQNINLRTQSFRQPFVKSMMHNNLFFLVGTHQFTPDTLYTVQGSTFLLVNIGEKQ